MLNRTKRLRGKTPRQADLACATGLTLLLLCALSAPCRAGEKSEELSPQYMKLKYASAAVKIRQLLDGAFQTNDPNEWRKAQNELVRMGPAASYYLVNNFHELRGHNQGIGAYALVRLKEPRLLDVLVATLKSSKLTTDDQVMKILARFRERRALPIFLEMLPGASGEKEKTLYYCLTFYGDPSACDVLLKGLHKKDRAINTYSVLALKKVLSSERTRKPRKKEDERRVSKLVDQLSRDLPKACKASDTRLAVALIELLGSANRREAADTVCDYADADSAAVASAAILALGNLGVHGRRHSEVVIRAIEDERTAVRLSAIQAAGMLGDKDAAPPIITQLERGDKRTQMAAMEALESLTKQELGPHPGLWLKWWRRNGAGWLRH